METPFETRYFTVTVDENGGVTDCDLDRIAAVDEETAEEYTQTAQQKKTKPQDSRESTATE